MIYGDDGNDDDYDDDDDDDAPIGRECIGDFARVRCSSCPFGGVCLMAASS